MPVWITLMRPSYTGLKNIIRKPGKGGKTRAFFVAGLTFVVWAMVFFFSVKVLNNLRAAEVVGDILCRRFLGLMWIAGSALLMFSCMISSLSNFFLSKDLDLLMAAPISQENIFWARSTQSLIASAWMPAAFMLPVFLAYGYVFKAPFLYYLAAPLASIPVLAGAGYLSQMLVMVLVNVFPARRTQEIMGLMAIMAFCLLYIAFRLMRPEDLLNPSGFMSAAAYLANLESSTSMLLPSEWALESIWPLLSGRPGILGSGWWLAFLWSTAGALAVLCSYLADLLFWSGYNKSMEGSHHKKGSKSLISLMVGGLGRLMSPQRRALVVKDLKTFFRDQAQWSQLILLAVLMVIYLYNFSAVNLSRFPSGAFVLENFFAFVNLGLVTLVASTLALRFAFPSISGEGFAYWIIKAAPMSLWEFMCIKFWLWFPPIWLVSMGLVVLGNYYLNVSLPMHLAGAIIIALLTPGLCALAIGLGGRYPRFDAANPSQAPTGYGGLVYMVTSSLASLAVIALSAWPIILFLRLAKDYQPGVLSVVTAGLSVVAALECCLYLMTRPMKKGLKALQEGSEEG